MAGVNITLAEATILLPITGTSVIDGDIFDGYELDVAAGDTVIIDGNTYTMASATSEEDKEFADFEGLKTIALADGLIIIGRNFTNVRVSKISPNNT
jgi:hypothetical protein